MQESRAFLIFIATASALVTTLAAQDKMSLQFLAFPKQIRPEPVELVTGPNKTIVVETPGNELSPVYKVPSLDSIVVGKTTVNDKGETVFETYGKAKSLGTSRQIILLLRKGKEHGDGFVIVPVNGELSDFKGGSYLFINASKENVGGIIGDSKFAIQPGQRQLLKPAPDHDGDICQVTLAYQREDKWKTFKDTRWSANDRYRTLVFFHQNPENGRLGVSPIIDMLPFRPSEAER